MINNTTFQQSFQIIEHELSKQLNLQSIYEINMSTNIILALSCVKPVLAIRNSK